MMSEMLAANQPVVVDDTHIISVWRDNLEQALNDIAQIVQTVRPPPPFPPAFRPRAARIFLAPESSRPTALC
jgi:hypothetical protein